MKSKKAKIIILILLIVVVIGTILFFLRPDIFRRSIELSNLDFFPFGDGRGQIDTPDTGSGEPDTDQGTTTDGFFFISRPRFRQLTDYPTSGYSTFQSQEEIWSQSSIELYNSTRGNAPESSLTTIPVTYARAVNQTTGFINDIYVDNSISTYNKGVISLPGHHESVVTGPRGNGIVYRYFNNRSLRIQTFLAQLIQPEEVLICSRNLEFANFTANQDQIYQFLEINNVTFTRNNESESSETDFQKFVPLLEKVFNQKFENFEDYKPLINENCQIRRDEYINQKIATYEIGDGGFLDDFISHVSILKNEGLVVGIIPDDVESSINVYDSLNPQVSKTILRTYFSEWIPQWVNNNMITLTTAASQLAPGFMYQINPITGSFDKILGDKMGFTTLTSPDGKNVLYTEIENNTPRTRIYNIEDNKTYLLGRETLPEKCVWSTKHQEKLRVFCAIPNNLNSFNLLPDDWYKDLANFNDSIWMFELTDPDSAVLNSVPLDNLQELSGRSIDAIKLELDKEENFLFMINKSDNTLWSYEIDGLVSE